MGAILSRWGKKPSTMECLTKIQGQIESIEGSKRDTMAWQKKVIGYLLAYFSLLYLVAAAIAYYRFFYHPSWQDLASQAALWLPFIFAPIIFIIVRKVLTWWYHRKIHRNESQLVTLVKKKTEILNDVMERETYKVAKEILEKFAPEKLSSRSMQTRPTADSRNSNFGSKTPSTPSVSASKPGETELRRRQVQQAQPTQTVADVNPKKVLPLTSSPFAAGADGGGGGRLQSTPIAALSRQQPASSLDVSGLLSKNRVPPRGMAAAPTSSNDDQVERRPPGPPLPRPILQRDRGYMDRMVEYLVGDGPSNRYALICKQCQSHNGMALREEFPFISYRCCYCHYWNPARKQRPVAPRLAASPAQRLSSSDSEEEELSTTVNKGLKPRDASPRPQVVEKKEASSDSAVKEGGSSEATRKVLDVEDKEEDVKKVETKSLVENAEEILESVDLEKKDDIAETKATE